MTRVRVLSAALLTLAVTVAAAPAARADMLQLVDGRVIDGVKMERDGDVIKLHYENGVVPVRMDLVEDYLIEGAVEFEARTPEEKAKRAEGLVPHQGKWVQPEVRAKAIAAEQTRRKKELEDYKNHQQWRDRYQFSTKNFEFESTLPPNINEQYSELLEAYFKAFGKAWKTKVPKDWGKLKVCFHRDLDSFHRVGGAGGGVLAYYRFVPPRELHFFHDRRNPANTLAAMFHEANHYLTDLMDEQFQYPHWINEAMAEYYGSAQWDPGTKKLTVGHLQLGRLTEVRNDVAAEKRLGVEEIVSSEDRDYRHYYWGWVFVHFLMETPKYHKNFKQYFVDLARSKKVDRKLQAWGGTNSFKVVSGETTLEHFKKRMKVKDLGALQAEWYEYVDGLADTGLVGLEQAGIQAFRQGRFRFRAPRLLKEAIDKGSTDADVFMTYAQCMLLKGEGEDAALTWYEKACEADPLDPNTWARRGYHLVSMGRKDDGERFIALAQEIDPEADFLDLEVARKLNEVMGDDE